MEQGRGEGETQRQREGGTEGEGGREILKAEGNTTVEEECFFFICPARERGWRKGGQEEEREKDRGSGERER